MNTLLLLTTSIIGTQSSCSPGYNGCGEYATCDHTFVEDAIYGCGGEWTGNGVSNGAYLCYPGIAFKQGYSICESKNVTASLGLTRDLCINDTITDNYLYVTLQSSQNGDLQCTEDGINDVFGCTSPTTSDELVYISENINCGPLGAVLQHADGKEPWKWGWEPYGDKSNELERTKHLEIQVSDDGGATWYKPGEVWGGVMCCKDEIIGELLPTEFSEAQLDRIDVWKSRTIYQILTDRFSKTNITDETDCDDLHVYCGGTFEGILNNLDYIEGLGYDTIWISPIVANTPNGYHGYWAADIYEINSEYGTEDEYFELVEAVHARNMYIMIDIVANHMGYGYNDTKDDYSMYYPFNESIYYHDSCNNDLCYNADTDTSCNIYDWSHYKKSSRLGIEECRLSGLPDLDQSNEFVADTLCSWLKDYVITKWKADAIRIDTVPEVDIQYWNKLLSTECLEDNIFTIGEYFWGDPALLGDYQPVFDSLLGYPMYYTMQDVFGRGDPMTKINERVTQYEQQFIDYEVLGMFTDNHDNNRWLCDFDSITNYANAILFQHTFPGIPIGYYGTEQLFDGCTDPENREVLWTTGFDTESEMYKYISALNSARKEYKIYNGSFNVILSEDDIYVYSRGNNALIVLANKGETLNKTINLYDSNTLTYGKYCNVFAESETDCFHYNGESATDIYIPNGQGKLYITNGITLMPTMTYTTGIPTVTVTDATVSEGGEDDGEDDDIGKASVINVVVGMYMIAFVVFIMQ